MTDNEIIKALECCCKNNNCEGCPLDYLTFSSQCASELAIKSLDIITRQQKEIEKLKECPKCVYEYDGEITEYCIQGPCSNFKTVEQIKSEAYKEFARRLKCGVPQETGVIRCSDIDYLLKEMVGEEK